MLYVLVVLEAILGLGLMLFIFMHSGKGTGLSMTFGGADSSFGGTGMVQKNLDRLTVGFAIAFFIVTIALGYVM